MRQELAILQQISLQHLHRGFPANLYLKQYPTQSFLGSISNVAPSQRNESGRVPVYFAFDTLFPQKNLEKYGFAVTKVDMGTYLSIPKEAVIIKNDHSLVYMLLKDGEIELRKIQIGLEGDNAVQIKAGLEKGDTVVTNPQTLLNAK